MRATAADATIRSGDTMVRAILVPLDGTGCSQRVLPHAEVFARGTGGLLILMQAAEGHAFYEEDAGGWPAGRRWTRLRRTSPSSS